MKHIALTFLLNILFSFVIFSQSGTPKVWVADNGDGTYKNPVLNADYSDPDVVRAGDYFYMVSSSFNCVPGIPVLQSKDLVNWTIIGHALNSQVPSEVFDKAQHGNGVWAPSIRYHNNEFYIYYPDPDYGIYMVKAKDAAGPWSEPILVLAGKGIIDPCPLWDDNGKAYLVHAWAGSRAGIKSILTIRTMNGEGTKVSDNAVLVFDGHADQPTIEGPKIYKRNGYYYIFAPAGGVTNGWQLVLRSKNIYGPYEKKIVMDQGKTSVNGPHQGGWVETQKGESWFLHFQDTGPYGRVVHLQPVKWINDWPVIGNDPDGDGKGEPVLTYKKPDVGRIWPIATPAESDEFNEVNMGLQWQWHANPKAEWAFTGTSGFLRLNAVLLPENFTNLWDVPSLLLQKFPAREFTITANIKFNLRMEGDQAGLIIMGADYSYISIKRNGGKNWLSQTICKNADKKGLEKDVDSIAVRTESLFLRVTVAEGAKCNFSYSTDGTEYIQFGEAFTARTGKWIGAKAGLFCLSRNKTNDSGYADVDWFRADKKQ